jgi:hypothetical protein
MTKDSLFADQLVNKEDDNNQQAAQDPAATQESSTSQDSNAQQAADPPVGTDPKTTDEPITTFYGDYKTKEEFDSHYNDITGRVTSYEEKIKAFDQDRDTWNADKANYERKISSQELFSADDDMLRLQKIKNEGNESKFKLFATLVMNKDSLSDLDMVKMDMIEKYPNTDQKMIEKIIRSDFGLDITEPVKEDNENYEVEYAKWEENKKEKEVRLQMKATEVKDKLYKEFNSIEIPSNKPKSDAEISILRGEAKKDWAPIMRNFIEGAAKLKHEVNFKWGDKEEKISFELGINPEQAKEYEEKVLNHVSNAGIKPEADNIKILEQEFKAVYLSENIAKISQQVFDKAVDTVNGYWKKQVGATGDLPPILDGPGADDPNNVSYEKGEAKIFGAQ